MPFGDRVNSGGASTVSATQSASGFGSRAGGAPAAATTASAAGGFGSRVAEPTNPFANQGNVFDRFGHGAASTISGIIPGAVTIGGALAHDTKAIFTPQLPGHTSDARPDQLQKKVIGPILGGYRDKYISRDVLHNMWQDPFGTFLDATLVGSAGLSRGFALGTLPRGGSVTDALLTGKYQGPLRTIKVQGELGAPVTVRTLPRQGARAARMTATDKLLKRLPAETPGLGEHARAARAINAGSQTRILRHQATDAYRNQQQAWGRLNARERVALNILNRVPLAHDLEAWKALIPADDLAAQKLASQLSDPKVRALYDEPNGKMLAAHEAATAAADYKTRLDLANSKLTAETAASAPFRHMRFARGGRVEQTWLPASFADLTVGQTVRKAGNRAEGKVVAIRGQSGNAPATVYYQRFGKSETVPVSALEVAGEKGWVNAPHPDDLRAEIQAAGRPLPYYAPDKMASARGKYVGGKSGGRTPPANPIHQSEGVLFNTGRVALHLDTLGPAFLRAANRDAAIEKHQAVLAVAVPAPGNKLQHGYRWVRARRGQVIPHTATGYGEHVHDIDETLPDFGEEGLTVKDAAADPATIATDAKGQRLMVPEHFAKVLENELTVQRSVLAKINHRVLDIWRALVLNLRIPWLENNVFGNTILAAIRFAGPKGLVAVLGMIRETRGVKAAAKALGFAESNGKHLDDALVREKLPELSRGGTFIGSNLPTGLTASWPGPLQKAIKVPKAITGFLPKIDRATEGALRRGSAETVLKGSPEVRALYKAMPEQTRSWHEAMSRGLDDPDLRRLVVREVNDAMGNFLSLTPAEQGAVRSLIPFYAWFREISRITLKLPFDAPGRTLMLAQLGRVGEQNDTLGPLPHYLQGAVGLGKPSGDLQSILALRAANPLTSAVDVLSGRNPVGELNPFVGAAVKYLGSGDYTNPASLYSLPGQMVGQVLSGLPETRVGTNPPSKLYPNRSRADLIAQFFGDLRREISLQQAHYSASQGQ